MHPGKHEPIISYETFELIQKRLESKAKVPTRKDLDVYFPLRGFVTCTSCGGAQASIPCKHFVRLNVSFKELFNAFNLTLKI